MRELRIQLAAANAEVEQLQQELADERDARRKDVNDLRDRYEARIEELAREAAKWQTRYEILKEQMEGDDEE